MNDKNIIKNGKQYGFTLVEVLIAVVVIIIGMWLMMNAFLLASEGIIVSERRMKAVSYVQEVMENYVISSDFGDSNLNASGGSKTSHSVDTVDGFTRSYDVWYVTSSNLYNPSGVSDYKRIQVKISDNNNTIEDVTLDVIKTDF